MRRDAVNGAKYALALAAAILASALAAGAGVYLAYVVAQAVIR